ncbi:DUF6470 family protein [Saccharibacillus brassicae]|uniref:YviE n=1 Tax=Saccharibacillus brassicae TaxID=2583377 RepID=A0A4Y6UUQ9_SACBS|nr:DUF6470 family protein [Saccharibacillus brassicae]QDH20854.1 hypothetical protein FFV09_08325 [Saccharibacillus brassicae]
MPSIPQIQIRQTPAKIGIETTRGQMEIRQPKPQMQQETQAAQLSIEQYKPQLTIDQSKAFAAYTGGTMRELNDRLVSGYQQNFMQALAKRVDAGNQLAAIHKPGNTIAEIYGTDNKALPIPESRGPASMGNVQIRFETPPPKIDFRAAKVDIRIETQPVEINYTVGSINMYLLQKNTFEIIPPSIDTIG